MFIHVYLYTYIFLYNTHIKVFDPREFSSTISEDIDDEEVIPLGRTADSTDSLVGLHTR
jgi:hypothetical protein